MTAIALATAALLGSGCGPTLVGVGAEMAADGASRGTERVASGGSAASGAAMAAAGVAVMAAGYKLTPRDQRTPNAAQPAPFTPTHRQPPRR